MCFVLFNGVGGIVCVELSVTGPRRSAGPLNNGLLLLVLFCQPYFSVLELQPFKAINARLPRAPESKMHPSFFFSSFTPFSHLDL